MGGNERTFLKVARNSFSADARMGPVAGKACLVAAPSFWSVLSLSSTDGLTSEKKRFDQQKPNWLSWPS